MAHAPPTAATARRTGRKLAAFAAALAMALGAAAAPPIDRPEALATRYAQDVDRRLDLPEAEQRAYASRLAAALQAAGLRLDRAQFVVLVDRSEHVQALLLWWLAPDGDARLIGASPVSTGRPSGFEHFETPTGVFDHTLEHPDFRAEGTRNELGLRGYGERGLRVFDFGWVVARRGWKPGEQAMRLQMHATDRERLEPRLGQRESKGCIRIPATLNVLLDRHAVLDAAYDEAIAAGRGFWVLRPDREPTPWSGRYLVVVDSQRTQRPDWSPMPARRTAAVPTGAAVC